MTGNTLHDPVGRGDPGTPKSINQQVREQVWREPHLAVRRYIPASHGMLGHQGPQRTGHGVSVRTMLTIMETKMVATTSDTKRRARNDVLATMV